jgi:predicted Zn-dependent peptidase
MVTSLREGTTRQSSRSVLDAAGDLGTTIGWSLAGTAGNGAPLFTTIKSAWQPALELVGEVVMYPNFPAEAVSRIQAAEAKARERPAQSGLPSRLITSRFYGPDHVYARISSLTDSSMRRVTHEDVVALHAEYVRPQNTVVVVAGDVTPAEARSAVEKVFASWQRGDKVVESKFLPALPQTAPTTIYLRDFPGALQSVLMFGTPIPSRGSADATAIEVADAILGRAGAGSRLYDAFRGQHGLSYSAASAISWRPEPQLGSWVAVPTVPAEKTDSGVTQLIQVLRGIHGERPVTQAELDFSRQSLIGSLPTQLETVEAQANSALALLRNGLPRTFYNDYVARMNALTLADVQAVATKYIDPDHLIISVVGDRAKIEPLLRATGIPVVIVDR